MNQSGHVIHSNTYTFNALSSESISIFSAEKDERSEEKRDIDDCSNFESNHVALVAISGTDRVYDDRSCNFM